RHRRGAIGAPGGTLPPRPPGGRGRGPGPGKPAGAPRAWRPPRTPRNPATPMAAAVAETTRTRKATLSHALCSGVIGPTRYTVANAAPTIRPATPSGIGIRRADAMGLTSSVVTRSSPPRPYPLG